MNSETIHIRIKKQYASELIEDLVKADAIEIVSGEIPEWQKEITLKRLKDYKNSPEKVISDDEFLSMLNEPDE